MAFGDAGTWVSVLGGGGLIGILVEVVRAWRDARSQRAELAAKAASAPAAAESLLLGNVDMVLAAQRKTIEELRAHAAWQESQIKAMRAQLDGLT